jgi:DNA-binding NtrC family response regulator
MNGATQRAVLLVDPDEASREAIASALRGAGYSVEDFPDYRGALATLESDTPLDCMVTALLLPKGTPHGVALGHMASVKRPGLPLFFVASSAEEAGWVDERWAQKVLMRPVDCQLLAAEISRTLGPSESISSR